MGELFKFLTRYLLLSIAFGCTVITIAAPDNLSIFVRIIIGCASVTAFIIWLSRRDKESPAQQNKEKAGPLDMPEFPGIRWIPAEDTPFGVRLIAHESVPSGPVPQASDSEQTFWVPESSETHFGSTTPDLSGMQDIACDLSYTFKAQWPPPDGVLFEPIEMEDKWVVRWHNGQLFFQRSWTGQTIYVCTPSFMAGEIRIDSFMLWEDADSNFHDEV